jgi:hypothetical protein
MLHRERFTNLEQSTGARRLVVVSAAPIGTVPVPAQVAVALRALSGAMLAGR